MPELPRKHFNPCCGYVTDAADTLPNFDPFEMPRMGDIAICFNCGALLYFLNVEGKLRVAYPGEVLSLTSHQRSMLRKVQKYIRKRGRIRKLN
jgi:hypothetical protein